MSATFEQYVEHWKFTHLLPTSYKPATRSAYGCVLANYLLPAFGHLRMTAVQSAHINEFKARLLRRGLSPKSVSNALTLLSKIFSDAIADGYLRHSPMEGVKKPKAGRK